MNAYIVGLVYVVFGGILLFYGAKFVKAVLAVLGAYVGINIGQMVVNILNFNGAWAFIVIMLLGIGLAYVAMRFYALFVAAAAALMLGQLTQAVAILFGMGSVWAMLLAFVVAVAGFFIIRRLDIIELLFKFITSVNGATALISGLLVMLDTSRLQALQTSNSDALLGTSTWWTVIWILLFLAGLAYQYRMGKNETLPDYQHS